MRQAHTLFSVVLFILVQTFNKILRSFGYWQLIIVADNQLTGWKDLRHGQFEKVRVVIRQAEVTADTALQLFPFIPCAVLIFTLALFISASRFGKQT